jgi:hypothetical protein
LVYNNYDDLFCYKNSTNDKTLNQKRMSELQFKLQLIYLQETHKAYKAKKIPIKSYMQINELLKTEDTEVIKLGIKKFHLCQ